MARDRAQTLHDAFQAELDRERAATLARAARRLEKQLLTCSRLLRSIDGAARPSPDQLEAYRAAWAESERLRWTFCVQREALGLLDHRLVDRMYPPPPKR